MAANYNKAVRLFLRIPLILVFGLLLVHNMKKGQSPEIQSIPLDSFMYKKRDVNTNISGILLGSIENQVMNQDQQNVIRRNILQDKLLVKQNTPTMCTKTTNAIFVKVHRTGSTTTWGIFARFVQKHRLNMVLPKVDKGLQFNYLSTMTKSLKDTILPLPVNVSYNVLCNHAIYKKTDFEAIMPKDTVKLGILRHPLSVSKSAFFYFGYSKELQRRHPEIEERLLFQKFLKGNKAEIPWNSRNIFNGMSHDFGMDPFQFSNISYVEQYINQLNKDFKLVIISELFEESLVLMKRYLCWDLIDILYIPVNRGGWRNRAQPLVTAEDKLHIERLNSADSLLYQFFKERLKRQIEKEDISFKYEVRHFKNIISNLQHFCRRHVESNTYYTVEKSEWNSEFFVDAHTCNYLRTFELLTLKYMIREAKAKYF